ncbi:MAG: NADH-quinone oxidoreductase subunit NuoF [Acidobacteriota bacterium]
MELILTKNIHKLNSESIDVYLSGGGYRSHEKALKTMTPDQVIEEVKKSGIRGRGGAGFPMGGKWGFVPKDDSRPHYMVCNADESEPGTFKDRIIIEKDPHLLIEGIIIGSYAIRAHLAFIYIRGEYVHGYNILKKAIAETYDKGFLGKNILGTGFNLDLILHRGAGAYICGEETALMDSIEGKRGNPRLKPPFPAQIGIFKNPTNINNVETLANVPAIIEKGGEWYSKIGRANNTGTKLYCLSGHIKRPGVYELPLGIPLRELIYNHGGGMLQDDRKLKAVIPGGSSVPVLTADQVDVLMDFDSLQAAGSMLGSAGIIVMDDSVCMVKATHRITKFYAHESCGQCTPCREGTGWMEKLLRRMEAGRGENGDTELLYDVAQNILGNTICPLGDAAAMPVMSFVEKFREEFEFHISNKRCMV